MRCLAKAGPPRQRAHTRTLDQRSGRCCRHRGRPPGQEADGGDTRVRPARAGGASGPDWVSLARIGTATGEPRRPQLAAFTTTHPETRSPASRTASTCLCISAGRRMLTTRTASTPAHGPAGGLIRLSGDECAHSMAQTDEGLTIVRRPTRRRTVPEPVGWVWGRPDRPACRRDGRTLPTAGDPLRAAGRRAQAAWSPGRP